MGMLFELLSTPPAYIKKALIRSEQANRTTGPIVIPFGDDRLQHCVLWEPDQVTHDTVVMYFHGGGYLVGTPESMIDAANVYNSRGYRFCSIGFRLMSNSPFPAQVDDAFGGVEAALAWLSEHGRPARRIVVGGSSCGGHLSTLIGYGTWLQRRYGFPAERIAGIISVAAVTDVDDMLLRPIPANLWNRFVDLPTEAPTTEARHRALLHYSPVALLDKVPESQELPPFFAIHGVADRMSPYAHELDFVRKLDRLGRSRYDGTGGDIACLCTVQSPLWQHMVTTVTLHKDAVRSSVPLSRLFSWLDAIDEAGEGRD
jgi:acetyl esterase/lipase